MAAPGSLYGETSSSEASRTVLGLKGGWGWGSTSVREAVWREELGGPSVPPTAIAVWSSPTKSTQCCSSHAGLWKVMEKSPESLGHRARRPPTPSQKADYVRVPLLKSLGLKT